jgi:hypothetical protein
MANSWMKLLDYRCSTVNQLFDRKSAIPSPSQIRQIGNRVGDCNGVFSDANLEELQRRSEAIVCSLRYIVNAPAEGIATLPVRRLNLPANP